MAMRMGVAAKSRPLKSPLVIKLMRCGNFSRAWKIGINRQSEGETAMCRCKGHHEPTAERFDRGPAQIESRPSGSAEADADRSQAKIPRRDLLAMLPYLNRRDFYVRKGWTRLKMVPCPGPS